VNLTVICNFSAVQEISQLLWNPNLHYRVISPLDLLYSHPNLVHISVRSSLILYSYLRLDRPGGLLRTGFPTKFLYAFLITIRATRSAHLINLPFINVNHIFFFFGNTNYAVFFSLMSHHLC
jgi:hypothetical protein